MKFNDLLLGIIVLVGGVAIYVSAIPFTDIPGQSYGAGTMPRAVSFVTMGLGLFLIGSSVVKGARVPRLEWADWVGPKAGMALLVAIGLVIFYIVLSPVIGFVPSAFVVMAALMLTLRTNPFLAIAVSVAACVVIQQSFGRLLLVPLPRSDMLGFLW